MTHPEILLVPALMLADYFLTVIGETYRTRRWAQHFRAETYELNPDFQEAVNRKAWFNPRHLVGTVLVAVLLWLFSWISPFPWLTEGLIGAVVALLGAVIGRHLGNILTFRYADRHPTALDGEVTMSHALLVATSMHQFLAALVPLMLVAIFVPTPFVIGAAVGVGLFVPIHRQWLRTHQKRAAERSQPDGDPGQET